MLKFMRILTKLKKNKTGTYLNFNKKLRYSNDLN